ncbi:MAG: hypothetical protein ACKVIX_00425 [Sphingomonadales bacterium]
MIKRLKPYYIIIVLIAMSGCGFSPLYMDQNSSSGLNLTLSQVSLSPIEGRNGQILITNLENTLAPFGQASSSLYSLNISIKEVQEGYGFRTDEAVTRENNRLDINYSLVKNSTGKVLTAGIVRSDMAYDIVQSDFANTQVRKDASIRNIAAGTTKLATILAIYFKKNFTPPPKVQ